MKEINTSQPNKMRKTVSIKIVRLNSDSDSESNIVDHVENKKYMSDDENDYKYIGNNDGNNINYNDNNDNMININYTENVNEIDNKAEDDDSCEERRT